MFKNILIVAALAGAFAQEKAPVSKTYVVSRDRQNWYQASINCRSAGMQLASVANQAEQDHLDNFLKANSHSLGYWMSGINLGNGNYYWQSTGTSVVFTQWLPNQPDNAKLAENGFQGENCIQYGIYLSSPSPIGWNDLTCNYSLPYICENISCDQQNFKSVSLVQ